MIPTSKLKTEIERDVDLPGFTIIGDSATIDRRPMINVMIASAYNPQALWDVINCSDNMADDGIKDAQYLSLKYSPVMQKFDPNGDQNYMVVFDGASNVKRGRCHFSKVPKVYCSVHVTEHVASLFMGEIFHKECLKIVPEFTCIVSSIDLIIVFCIISNHIC